MSVSEQPTAIDRKGENCVAVPRLCRDVHVRSQPTISVLVSLVKARSNLNDLGGWVLIDE